MEFSGGIWIGWKNSIDLEVVSNHSQFILVRICSKLHPHPVFVAFVYGSPDKQKRKILWNDLSHIVHREYVPWMAIGDFNAILSSEDKKNGHVKGRRCQSFGDFTDNALLHDLGFQGPPFTWHRGFLSERLDKAVGNDSWVEAFPNCLITHLPRIKSDHRPLLMKFCYDDNCQEVLIRDELENTLHHEEMLWKQKSRCEWLNLGDRNTSYFHRQAVNFFQKLYRKNPGLSRSLPSNAFPRLNIEYVDYLGQRVMNEEIRAVLFDMAPLKAPGSDGFQVAFFQNQWDNRGETICEWVKKVFEGGTINPEFNNTLIELIPKVSNLENFS
ncbi:hypothetical protein CXB51_036355 [Gossypium anomalum]|uniref:Endonuclease/exonuclease/phosphatase domain-containing protein n=1 Tax=Gossypium anomalum TaxID=47600 RepID=A0A8J6CII3_9ROSI|nr:hypothetical protein CXB51_036355 [Gossypium anomalum]